MFSWFCTFVCPFAIAIFFGGERDGAEEKCYGGGDGGRENVTGKGSPVLLVGPSSRSSTKYTEILKSYDKKEKKE